MSEEGKPPRNLKTGATVLIIMIHLYRALAVCLTSMFSFNTHNSMKALLPSAYRWGNWAQSSIACLRPPNWYGPCLRIKLRAFLVAQWLRIRLPMQGTRVRALAWEDPTCRGATKPMRHDYWACALEPTCHATEACAPRAHAPQQEKPRQWEAHAPQWRVAPTLRS